MNDLFDNPPRVVKATKRSQLSCVEKTIMSVSFDQEEILQNILDLFCPDGFDCDASYGYGGFYNRIARPLHRFDIAPKVPDVTTADSRSLPLASGSLKSIVFDPPFVVSNHKESEEYVMSAKYGGYRTITQLREHYRSSLDEFARVLKSYGVVVFKCQDFVHGRSNYFIHDEVLSMAREAGFLPVDLFILVAKNRFIGFVSEQNHARKFHSYFWVFKRVSRRKKP